MECSIPPAGSKFRFQETDPAQQYDLMPQVAYPKNHWLRNPKVVVVYLYCRRQNWRIPGKLVGLLLGCDVSCPVPERLFIPHPTGIVCGEQSVLHNDVVLMQQVT